MTHGNKLAWDDTVLPFQLDRSDIRGRVARLDGVLEGILKQHDYPATGRSAGRRDGAADRDDRPDDQAALEAVAAGAVQGRRAHDRHRLLRPAAKRASPPVSAPMPAIDADRLTDGAPLDQVGEGYFAIMIDQGEGMTPYQGITPLTGGSLASLRRGLFRPVRTAADAVSAQLRAHRPNPACRNIGAPAV